MGDPAQTDGEAGAADPTPTEGGITPEKVRASSQPGPFAGDKNAEAVGEPSLRLKCSLCDPLSPQTETDTQKGERKGVTPYLLYLIQESGSSWQSRLHMKRSQCSQPMVGVIAKPLSRALAPGKLQRTRDTKRSASRKPCCSTLLFSFIATVKQYGFPPVIWAFKFNFRGGPITGELLNDDVIVSQATGTVIPRGGPMISHVKRTAANHTPPFLILARPVSVPEGSAAL